MGRVISWNTVGLDYFTGQALARAVQTAQSECAGLGSINATATPAVAFEPNSLWVSPILPCHKSKCHQPVGAEVFDTTPDPATELPTCSHDIMYLLTCKPAASRSATVPAVP